MGQSGLSSGREIMMDYLPVLLVASLLGLGLADPEPSLAAVNRVVQSFVHPSSSSASQPTYNAPSPSYSSAASYSKPKPAYGAPPEDKCYIKPSLNKEPSNMILEIQQLLNITYTPDPCLDGEAHSYHYTNANKQPYIIMINVNKLIRESFTPDEEEPYGHHGNHGRIKRQNDQAGQAAPRRRRRSEDTGSNDFEFEGSLVGNSGFGNQAVGSTRGR